MNKFEALSYLSTISEDHERSFNDFLDELRSMEDIMDQYPEYSGYVLSLCVNLATDEGFNFDVMPATSDLFSKAAKISSDKEVDSVFKRLLPKNSKFAFYAARETIEQSPKFAEHLFPLLLEQAQSADINQVYLAASAVAAAIKASSEDKIPQMTESVFSSDNNGIKSGLYEELANIYKKHPSLEAHILGCLTDSRFLVSANYGKYFENIGTMAEHNPKFNRTALNLLEDKIKDSAVSSAAMGKAFGAIENILMTADENDKARCMQLLRQGLENPLIERRYQIKAFKLLGETEQLKSKVSVYKRGEKTEDNVFGMTKSEQPNIDEPCVLVLGGDGTRSEKALNGYLGDVYYLLKEHGLQNNASVYGVVYDFGEYLNVNTARTHQMEKYKRNVHLKAELPLDTADPKYVKEIFDKFILGRISTDGGKNKIPTEQAADNIRKLNIVAHCHGAYTALKLEEMMQQKMAELGYSKEDAAKIQKQLLILAQSPYCPLGQSKSMFISYASVADMEVDHYNNFEDSIRRIDKKQPIPLSYFPDKQGNIFLVSNMGKECEQHNHWGFRPTEEMNKEGKTLVLMAAKMLISGVKNSLEEGGRLQKTQDLLVEDENGARVFAKISENGQKIYKQIVADSIINRKLSSKDKQI